MASEADRALTGGLRNNKVLLRESMMGGGMAGMVSASASAAPPAATGTAVWAMQLSVLVQEAEHFWQRKLRQLV